MANGFTRWISSLSSVIGKAVEGAYRPGPYALPVTGGFLPDAWGKYLNFWQMGYDPMSFGAQSAIVEACVSAYSQTIAMCTGDHWRGNKKGGRTRVSNSALSRILREPNDYQSISDFLLNAVRNLYLDGNAYIFCARNSRFEINELHLMSSRASRGLIAEDGSIFYELAGNWIVDRRFGSLPHVPMRDVLHIRLHQGRREDPLLGETPLVAALLDAAAGDAIKQQQLAFFLGQAKPGYVLSTDILLAKDVVESARDRFNAQSKDGGTVILNGGLKPVAIPQISGRDAQVAEIMKMTKEDIALAFRIPLQLLGLAPAPHGATAILMQEWIATGLGFALEHVENAFAKTFNLDGEPDEYVEFSTDALLRSAFKDRIEALARGVQGGIYSPNEARAMEDLDAKPFGDEPRVQQQLVPISAASGIPAPKAPGKTIINPASPPAPSAPGQPGQPGPPGPARSPPDANISRILSHAERLRRTERPDRRIAP
jgi:HK97 family phage portal protein